MKRAVLAVAGSAAAAAAVVQFGPAVAGVPGVTGRLPAGLASGRHPAGLALTFDDGPHPEGTPAVLRILANKGICATFFLIAEQLARFPDWGRAIVAEGHEIAVHGWDHTPLTRQGPIGTLGKLAAATDLIGDVCRANPVWFRPPYGVASGAALLGARSLGLQPIWWTRWARDWSPRATAASIARRSTRGLGAGARAGEVLLLHDSDAYGHPGSWQHTVAALPLILRTCDNLGVSVGSLATLESTTVAAGHCPEFHCPDLAPRVLGKAQRRG